VFGCTHTDEGRAIRSSPSGSDALALGRPLLSLTQKTSENKVIGHCPLFMNRFKKPLQSWTTVRFFEEEDRKKDTQDEVSFI
jgi:hypothetical protein